MTELQPFDGRDVLRTAIAVTNAGDGLSDAMSVDPRELHVGETVYLLIEAEVAKIRFESIKDTEALARVHVLRAGTATFMEADQAEQAIDTMRDRVLKAKEAERGISRLPYDDDGEHGLAHARGEHAEGLVTGCPVCQHETDQLAAEEADARPTPIGKRRRAKAEG